MLDGLARPFVHAQPLTRTYARAARVGAFALESWSRLRLEDARGSAHERALQLSWLAENLCALHGVRARLRGSVPSGPCVLVANHLSYFDPVVLAAETPLVAIAKRDVADWPLVGEACRRLGVSFVVRGDGHSGARVLREASRALAAGVSVLVFPEGTTTRGEQVLPFKRGIFGVAQRARVPVIPVALRYDREDAAWVGDEAFLPHYVRGMAHVCTRVSVEYLPPLPRDRGQSANELAELARRSIARALAPSERPQAAARLGAQRLVLATA
ncbi:MAG TPA: lysophospholipid acyltransferase family protein [Polyangiales bacterium]